VIDDAGQVELLAKDTVKNIYAEAARETSESRRKELAKWALSSESRQRLSAMVALAQSEPGIPIKHDEPNRNRWLINCLNGTLDLRTGELKPHDRADLITKIAPVEYRMGAPCPNWLSFLNMIFEGNQDLIAFVQRAVGYSLTGITDERCMFILWGKGKNGKSTFLETIGRMMGDYAEKTTAETLLTTRQTNIPNDIARLQGARFVRASESEHGRYLAEARIKEMTGQDMIAARFLFSEWFSFIPEFKIWLGTNHKPVIRGTDEAIWDRIKLIPFTVRIDNPKPRREIDAMFSEELAGIFSWAVEGCMEWQDHGLGVAEEVRKATAEYRYEMDNIGRFIEECCEVGEYFRTPSSELYEAYKAWAEDVGVEVLSSQSFGRRLTELGFEAQRNTTGQKKWMRQGIRINDD
jgi:putative DNA primase/helicase